MTAVPRARANFYIAGLDCQDIKGRVADYSDYVYRLFRADLAVPPLGFWLGPQTANHRALFVDRIDANANDVDGETNVNDLRFYNCAHDDTN